MLWFSAVAIFCLCAVVAVVVVVVEEVNLGALQLDAGPSIFISLPAIERENRLGGSSLE